MRIVLTLTLVTLFVGACSKPKSTRQLHEEMRLGHIKTCHEHLDSHQKQRCIEESDVHYDEYRTRLEIDRMRREGIIH